MDLDVLKKIIKIAKDDGIAELKFEVKDFKVELRFPNDKVTYTQAVPHVAQVTPQSTAPIVSKPAISADASTHVIKSPFVGTFYAAPGPGKSAYVKVGDKVRVGQTLCVLEAMKIMNEIDADVSGEIVEICVDNESLVEFGQPLFRIKL